jgi:hypothetical protein
MAPKSLVKGVLTLLMVTLAFAGDFWEEKPYKEWSNKEVLKMLERSPWAREVKISTAPMSLRASAPTTQRGTGSASGELNLVVRWESSLPIKQAQVMKRYTGPEVDLEEAQQYLNQAETSYIVSVSGEGFRPTAGDSKSEDDEQMLKQRAVLKIKGQPDIRPESVEVSQGQGFAMVVFSFPRNGSIQLESKNIQFELDLERYHVRSRFKLKEMVFQGRLEL